MSDLEPTQAGFGRRHPVLVTILIVFGFGFLSGALISPTDNILLSGLIGGVGGTTLFLLLASTPALVWTVVQSIRHLFRHGSYGDRNEETPLEPFPRRLKRNLEGTMELLIWGWH